jgi:hypothetical protein
MVAPTLLRTGRVTLAETIDPSGHRTPTSDLGLPLIKTRKQPIDENGGHCRLDLDSWLRAITRRPTTSTW